MPLFTSEFFDTLSLMRYSLLLGALMGAVCPLVGVYFVLRRILFLGVTLPQVSSAGVAFALLAQSLGWFGLAVADPHALGAAPLAGSMIFTVLAILPIARMERRGRGEAAIGMIYALAAAWSILLVAHVPFAEASLLNLLRGEIIGISGGDTARTALAFAVAAGAFLCFHREFLLVSYDRELAISLRRNAALWDVLFYLVAALVISVSVMGAGPIATFGYLVLPPLIALQLVSGMGRVLTVAAALGVLSSLVGFYLAYQFDLPLGPASVALMGVVYLLVAGVKGTGRFFRGFGAFRSSSSN